jgi:zinc transport system substrate-binding protein
MLVFTLSACKNDDTDEGSVIYVTVYPMEYLVQEIAGDTVTVKRIPGSTTHGSYVDWSAKDIIDIKDSDLLFYINGGADDFIPNSSQTFEGGNVELIDMSQHITYNMVCYSHTHEDEETFEDVCNDSTLTPDPHFWLDPIRMAKAAEYVKDKLIATYPENSALIENNFTSLNAALTQLNSDYELMALEVTKPIITTVMLFTYWADRYGLEVLSITTDAHSASSTIDDMEELLKHAEEENIVYILFEKNSNSPAGNTVLEELTIEVPTASALYLHGCGNITPDEEADGETYLTLMYGNLEILKIATK